VSGTGLLALLLSDRLKADLSLICYVVVVIGAGWFLVVASRKAAPTQRREPFRKPTRVRALGYLLGAGDGIFILTGSDSGPTWKLVVALAWLAVSVLVMWAGHRMYSRVADAYPPGKHADPASPPESRWRWRR
jgi:hypothetical protein